MARARISPAAFGESAVAEGRALAARAPLDLRVNTLKATREKAQKALAHLGAEPTPLSPLGLRVPLSEDGRSASLAGEPAYLKGLVEIQDEGSQLAAQLCAAQPGEQVLDLCAGGGGKTLALAAAMDNRGQIYATDREARRLGPLYARLERAATRNVQVRTPARASQMCLPISKAIAISSWSMRLAPGTGTWRRNPDAKWRIRPGALEQRVKEQDEVLESAALYVKPGGRLVYITCSLLAGGERGADRGLPRPPCGFFGHWRGGAGRRRRIAGPGALCRAARHRPAAVAADERDGRVLYCRAAARLICESRRRSVSAPNRQNGSCRAG